MRDTHRRARSTERRPRAILAVVEESQREEAESDGFLRYVSKYRTPHGSRLL